MIKGNKGAAIRGGINSKSKRIRRAAEPSRVPRSRTVVERRIQLKGSPVRMATGRELSSDGDQPRDTPMGSQGRGQSGRNRGKNSRRRAHGTMHEPRGQEADGEEEVVRVVRERRTEWTRRRSTEEESQLATRQSGSLLC